MNTINEEQQKHLLQEILKGVRELAEVMELQPTEALRKAREMVIGLRALRAAKEADQCLRS